MPPPPPIKYIVFEMTTNEFLNHTIHINGIYKSITDWLVGWMTDIADFRDAIASKKAELKIFITA